MQENFSHNLCPVCSLWLSIRWLTLWQLQDSVLVSTDINIGDGQWTMWWMTLSLTLDAYFFVVLDKTNQCSGGLASIICVVAKTLLTLCWFNSSHSQLFLIAIALALPTVASKIYTFQACFTFFLCNNHVIFPCRLFAHRKLHVHWPARHKTNNK